MNPCSNKVIFLTYLLCFTLLLSACASNSSSSTNNAVPPVANSAGTTNETAAFPRTVKDAEGDFTLPAAPQKVALVHWGLSDVLLTFDVASVGLALPFTYEQSVLGSEVYKPYIDKLDELVIVGENTNVNLEAVLEYEPDLIIAGSDMNKEIRSELTKIAPTYFVDEAKTNVWQDWQSVMTLFGELLGQEEQALSYITDFEHKVTEARNKLTALEGTVAFVQVRENTVWLQGTSYLSQFYEGLGLKAPDAANMDEGGQLTLEGLSVLDPDHLFLGYFNFVDRSIPALTDEWKQSEVWKRLKSVQNNQAYPMNGELALGFGPIGKAYGIDAIAAALE